MVKEVEVTLNWFDEELQVSSACISLCELKPPHASSR